MYHDIQTVTDKLKQSNLPLIFFDTCTILNILNSVHSHVLPADYFEIMSNLLKKNGIKCWLASCQNVHEEWNDNNENVLNLLQKQIKLIDKNFSRTINVANSILGTSHAIPSITHLDIETRVKQLSEIFLNTTYLIVRKDEYSIKGMNRIRKCEAPAQRGKQEAKDCEIIECFLDLSNTLRSEGFAGEIIFFTANEADFGKPNQLRSPLDIQFQQMNAQLITNITHLNAIVMEYK